MSKTAIGFGSGNLDLPKILRRGPEVWNQWRKKNPDTKIDLSDANLSDAEKFSSKQIKSANNWESATYNDKRLDDPEVSKQLGLDTLK
ncbi:MAG: hypothetical protein HC851_19980 [Acaryochloris sp. RU_4_1]|nr:hypothetical protein [Acaryochloris sp. SU_5_25]NJM67777.1 hypothetical protein [Acaryochloris sp. RU_4_1]NJN39328.1 hypothetical protein [Acaryochloridaceae cyanobacterium CSU_3_4]NJR55048.1 hypothetical protein [Acaryochloris sp. CRU_2_0]